MPCELYACGEEVDQDLRQASLVPDDYSEERRLYLVELKKKVDLLGISVVLHHVKDAKDGLNEVELLIVEAKDGLLHLCHV